MLHDGDLYATVTEYLDHRSRTLQKRMKRR
jgi:hypothetical protein